MMSPLGFRFIPRWLYSFPSCNGFRFNSCQKHRKYKRKERHRNIKAELIGPNTKRRCIQPCPTRHPPQDKGSEWARFPPGPPPASFMTATSLYKLNCSTAACVSSQTPPTLTVPKDSCWAPCMQCLERFSGITPQSVKILLCTCWHLLGILLLHEGIFCKMFSMHRQGSWSLWSWTGFSQTNQFIGCGFPHSLLQCGFPLAMNIHPVWMGVSSVTCRPLNPNL